MPVSKFGLNFLGYSLSQACSWHPLPANLPQLHPGLAHTYGLLLSIHNPFPITE